VAPRADIATLVIDCADVEPMVKMYAALGAEPDPRYPGHDALLLSGLTMCFQRVEGYRAPTWPTDEVPTRIHLDFFVDSLDEMARHLERHGATRAPIQPHLDGGLIVMLDPAGHPFCIATRL
jgi:hypothetical protein